MIKKYLGIVGFLLSLVGIITTIICERNGTDTKPLGEISFFFWISTMTISSEINKKKQTSGGYTQYQQEDQQQLLH